MSDKRKIGMFEVSIDVYKNCPADLKLIQKDMTILRTEDNILRHAIRFYAEGNMFDAIDDGEIVPSYTVVICSNDDGSRSVLFKRQGCSRSLKQDKE
jgi:hypothetical protein